MNNNESVMINEDIYEEKTNSILDYQNTCSEFIMDISKDYKDWVDRYNLENEESQRRKNIIDTIIHSTNQWIHNYGNNIKKIDIIMNDGINKMAENTAGYPFSYKISMDQSTKYIFHKIGKIKFNIKAIPRNDRSMHLGRYDKENIILFNSNNNKATYCIPEESFKQVDLLDDYIIIDASDCNLGDIISFTVVVEETKDNNVVTERRGISTITLTVD